MRALDMLRAIGGIDDELIARAAPKAKKGAVAQTGRVTATRWLRWAVPLAACVAVAAIVAAPILSDRGANDLLSGNTQSAGTPMGNTELPEDAPSFAGGGALGATPEISEASVAGAASVDIGDIRGLPTSDYTWDEGEGVAADRMATNELRQLMREFDSYNPNVLAAFAIVTVNSVERFTDERGDGQIVDCGILYDVLGDGSDDTALKIVQQLYGGCVGDEQTNLLRIGGVYVLPVVKFSDDKNWRISGDLDVLFEVDDSGLIHSHSRHEQLSKYDGKELSALWQDIVFLYDNPLLRSPFAEYIASGYKIDAAGREIALVGPNGEWSEEDVESFTAKIDEDGKIVIATEGFNVFRPLEGMTLEEWPYAIPQIRQYLGLENYEN